MLACDINAIFIGMGGAAFLPASPFRMLSYFYAQALEDCQVLPKVKRIAGSSAGAICAGLLAVGCRPQDIADVFKCDIKWLFHGQLATVIF